MLEGKIRIENDSFVFEADNDNDVLALSGKYQNDIEAAKQQGREEVIRGIVEGLKRISSSKESVNKE